MKADLKQSLKECLLANDVNEKKWIYKFDHASPKTVLKNLLKMSSSWETVYQSQIKRNPI